MVTVGFTGHRPHKLFKDNPYSEENKGKLIQFVKDKIIPALDNKFGKGQWQAAIGMALGFDQAVAYACIDMAIPYLALLPFRGQEKRWPHNSQVEYQSLLHQAKEIRVTSPGVPNDYNIGLIMQSRNEAIVNASTCIVALSNGQKSGTSKCIDYALKQDKKVYNCWLSWINF